MTTWITQFNSVAATSWAPNRLDVFAVDSNAHIRHKAWDGSKWDAGWEDLGVQSSTPNVSFGAVVVASWGSNRLDLVASGGDGSAYHKAWDGQWQANWEQVGTYNNLGYAAVACWGPNRLDVFAGEGWHNAWNGTRWMPEWEELPNVGFSSHNLLDWNGAPAVVAWGPNRLDVFGLGTGPAAQMPGDSYVYHKAWADNQWVVYYGLPSTWELLGQTPGGMGGPPAAASWAAGRLDVFALGFGGVMYHNSWNGSAWQTGWDSLGIAVNGPPPPPPGGHSGGAPAVSFQGAPAVVSRGPYRLDLFCVGTDNGMYHRAYGPHISGLVGSTADVVHEWDPEWEKLDGTFISSPPVVVTWGADRMDVFGAGADGGIYHKAYLSSQWQTGWESLGIPG